MKKILIMFLVLALTLSFCGSSLVFADEAEDPLGGEVQDLLDDTGEPPVVSPVVSVEVADNPDETTNTESKPIAEDVNGNVSVMVDGNGEESQNTATLEVSGDVNGDVSVVVDGNENGSQNAATLEVSGDVNGSLEVTDGAQTKGIFETTDGNGEASVSNVSVDIGGDVESVKITAGESDKDATSTVDVHVGGDVVADGGSAVRIYGVTESAGEQVDITMNVDGNVVINNEQDFAGIRGVSAAGYSSGPDSERTVNFTAGDVIVNGTGEDSFYTGIAIDPDISVEETSGVDDLAGLVGLLSGLINENTLEKIKNHVLDFISKALGTEETETLVEEVEGDSEIQESVSGLKERLKNFYNDWKAFCEEHGHEPLELLLNSSIGKKLHELFQEIIAPYESEQRSGNMITNDSYKVGNVIVNVTGEASEGRGISVEPSVTAENSTARVTVNAESIQVNSTGTARGMEIAPYTSGLNSSAVVNVDVEGDVTAISSEPGGQAYGVEAQNSTIRIGGNLVTKSQGKAEAIKVHDDTNVTVEGSVESSDRGIIMSGSGSTVVIGAGDQETMTEHALNVKGDAITVTVNTEQDGINTVVVEGTVSTEGNTLVLDVADANSSEAVIANLPEIIVQTISPDADIVVAAESDELDKDEIIKEMFAKISYIVTTSGVDEATVTIIGTETKMVGDKTYLVAHENSQLIVKNVGSKRIVGVSVGGDNQFADVKDNGDGTFTITVNRGGNLDISVAYEEPVTPEPLNVDAIETDSILEEDPWENPQDDPWADQLERPWDVPWENPQDEQWGELPLFTFDDDGFGIDVGKKVLILNLLEISKADIEVAEFERYAEEGYEVLYIRTPKYTYRITMEDLLELFKDGEMSTFIVHEDQIQILLDEEEVLTLTVADALEDGEVEGDQIEIPQA